MNKMSRYRNMDEVSAAVGRAVATFEGGLVTRKGLDIVLSKIFEQAVLDGVIDSMPEITVHNGDNGSVH